jgi:hypothetical protein
MACRLSHKYDRREWRYVMVKNTASILEGSVPLVNRTPGNKGGVRMTMPKHAHEPLNGRKDFGPERALGARPPVVAPSAGRPMDFNHGVRGAAQSRRREIKKDPEWVVEHLLGGGMGRRMF